MVPGGGKNGVCGEIDIEDEGEVVEVVLEGMTPRPDGLGGVTGPVLVGEEMGMGIDGIISHVVGQSYPAALCVPNRTVCRCMFECSQTSYPG